VAEIKPLRLKVQKSAPIVDHAPASSLPVATVLVDSGVFHLDEPFDYLVSEKLNSMAQPGHLVAVSFHGRQVQGYILERKALDQAANGSLKYIDRVLSSFPLLTPEQYSLAQAVSHRYACSLWSVISAAIPARIASAEKNFSPLPKIAAPNESHKPIKQAIRLPATTERLEIIAQIVGDRAKLGQVLIVVPEESDLELLEETLRPEFSQNMVVQSSSRPASERYKNYLEIVTNQPQIILTTRSGLFTPLVAGSSIIVYEEPSSSHYEKRYPGWNSRDVSLLRPEHSLIFLGYSWSAELSRLIALGFVDSITESKASEIAQQSRKFHFAQGRDSHLATISRGLRGGSVLISIANPSPLTGLLCRKCHNRALCECGGALVQQPKKSMTCSLCTKVVLDWRCDHCSHSEVSPSKKDPATLAENLSRAFPGIRVILSSAKNRVSKVVDSKTLVIATIGHEPLGKFTAIALLDGEYLYNRPGLRTEETMLSHWLSLITQATNGAEIFISLPQVHPISRAIADNDVDHFLAQTLADRAAVELPPYYRFALIEMDNKSSASFITAADQSGIFSMITPVTIDSLHTRVILRAPVERSAQFSDFFLSLSRYRSLKGLSSFDLRIDPYSF